MGIKQWRKICVIACALLLLLVVVSAAGCCSGLESIDVDGVTRQYLLHVPEQLPEGPVPLVLALHQFSDTPRGMRRMTRFNALADREGFIVVYPRGQWRAWRSEQRADGADHRFLLSLVDALVAHYPIDEARIFATGASAGAMMIQALACHTDRLAAIAPVMGSMPEGDETAYPLPRDLPVLVIHGVEDPVIPYAGGRSGGPHEARFLSAEETAAFWAHAAGCDETPVVETETMPGPDGVVVERFTYACPVPLEVVLYAVGGCGHSWPGHLSCYPSCVVGPSVSEPDASEMIWDFFKRHSQCRQQ